MYNDVKMIRIKNNWASLLSTILNPDNVISLTLILIIFKTFEPNSLYWWIAIVVLFNFLFGYIWLFYVENLGFQVDEPLENRGEKRTRIMAMIPQFFVLVFEIILSDLYGRAEPFYATLIFFLASGILFAMISFFWKVSAHAATTAALFTILALIYSPWFWLLFVLSPIIGYARLILDRHTPTQLVFGNIAAILLVLFIFSCYKVI